MAILSVGADDLPPEVGCPGIVLLNPKFSANVINVHRLAACFGVPQVWCTGHRVGPELGRKRRTRLPPEERMRGFGRVDLVWCERALDLYVDRGAQLVGVELAERAVSLLEFEHHAPRHAGRIVYVFGPEDDQQGADLKERCEVLVQIPAFHCLNLATAVAAVMWDRTYKLWRDHGVTPPGPEQLSQISPIAP